MNRPCVSTEAPRACHDIRSALLGLHKSIVESGISVLLLLWVCTVPLFAQVTPDLPHRVIAYPDSPSSLQHYFEDLRSEFRINDAGGIQEKIEVPTSKEEALQKELSLPNATVWFTQVFGEQAGPRLADVYSSFNPVDTVPLFGAFSAKGAAFFVLRLKDVGKNGSDPIAKLILKAMKTPISSYVIDMTLNTPTAGPSSDMQLPYYFFYVDGEFRPIIARVFDVLDTAQTAQTRATGQLRPISEVPPVYPPLARQARIAGDVMFRAQIGRDGTVQKLDLVYGHPLLVQAATDAARQWRYKPSPSVVETTITIRFILLKGPENEH
jgi:TonB family protein